jgi:hypothetical protein
MGVDDEYYRPYSTRAEGEQRRMPMVSETQNSDVKPGNAAAAGGVERGGLTVGPPRRPAGSSAYRRRRRDVAIAGYVVVGVFILAFAALYSIVNLAHDRLGWLAPSTLETIALAGVIALPLALAFIWERVQGVKLFGVEVSLAALREAVPPIDSGISAEMQAIQSQISQAGASGLKVISQRIKEAVRSETVQLVEVDLGYGEAWWSTRVYLLAALLDAYTRVPQLVFISAGDAGPRRFVGMASPADTRTELARAFPPLEQAFLQATNLASLDQAVAPFAGATPIYRPPTLEEIVDRTIEYFGRDLPNGEAAFRQWVTPQALELWLGRSLLRDRISWPGLQINNLFLLRVLEREHPYVALVEGERLREVVDRSRVATQIAVRVLERQLEAAGRDDQ